MSDVEENNFEGSVSTKPREPSSAAAPMLGVSRGRARRAGLRGVWRGPAGSSLWSHRGRFFTSQDGFWVTLLPQIPRITPLPPFFGDWLIAGLLGPIPTRPAGHLASPHPEASLSLFRGVGPRRGGAGGDGREFPSGRIVVGASCGGVSGDPEHRRGSRGRKCAGLLSGRGEAGAGLAGACVSLALYCSERPRLCWNRQRCVYKGESLEVEGGTSLMKWLVNDRTDP